MSEAQVPTPKKPSLDPEDLASRYLISAAHREVEATVDRMHQRVETFKAAALQLAVRVRELEAERDALKIAAEAATTSGMG